MDEGLERALAASRVEHAAHLDDDEKQLQAAIELSKLDGPKPSTSFEDQLRERRAGMKRKAEEEFQGPNTKRATPVPLAQNPFKLSSADDLGIGKSLAAPSTADKATITFDDGALRITRTPGREKAKNCVNLRDLVHKRALLSACVFSFYIGNDELFDHLPFSHASNAAPIYIGRDANMDPLVAEACQDSGVSFQGKLSNKNLQSVRPSLEALYHKRYGKNYNAFYAWSPGSSHSKILLLVYLGFMRIVITSCNMMDIDTVLGDNHWYIHDVPKLVSDAKMKPSAFEADLLAHLEALSTPEAFIKSIKGAYDYSKIEVHLVTSAPGVCSGAKAEKHGLLRLRRVVQSLDLKFASMDADKLRLEVCAASIGNLSAKWLNGFNDCALGKAKMDMVDLDKPVPDMKLFYPSVGDVKNAYESAQDAASNIGCHTRPWESAPLAIKKIFYHYKSKDAGRLFHQKIIMTYDPSDTDAYPYYIYVGSANLSQSAWGALDQDKKLNDATCNTKLVKITNFECGVVIPGHMIAGLMESGTESWQKGIIPYEQTAPKYDLTKDKPWNGQLLFLVDCMRHLMALPQTSAILSLEFSMLYALANGLIDPRWVQNLQEGFQGS